MFYDSDIDVFFSDFAEDVIYTASGTATPVTMGGVFDVPGSIITIGKATMIIEKPQVSVKTVDFPSISGTDTFTIRSTVYKVVSATNDGTGITTVILAEGKR